MHTTIRVDNIDATNIKIQHYDKAPPTLEVDSWVLGTAPAPSVENSETDFKRRVPVRAGLN